MATKKLEQIAQDLAMVETQGNDIAPEVEENDKSLKMDVLTLTDFQTKFSTDKDNRQYTDWSWFVYDNYVKGNHFVKYNDITQMVEAVPTNGNSRFAINKIWTTLRAVRGFVTKYDPKWYIFPENVSADAMKKAHYKQKLLDDQWTFGQMKVHTKQNVFQGLKYSIGILELAWNKEEQKVDYFTLDPYDVYLGGPAYPFCTRVTKAIWRTKDEIENDEKYKKKVGDFTSTDSQFASTWKQTLQQEVYGYQNKAPGDEGSIVYETHYITSKPNSKGGKVNIATYTDSTFLRHVETSNTSLWDTFQFYRTDDNPGENYGEGWVKNLIPPQKLLDILPLQWKLIFGASLSSPSPVPANPLSLIDIGEFCQSSTPDNGDPKSAISVILMVPFISSL